MNYKMIEFQKHGDARGMLVAVEEGKEIPFEVKRVYYMYDIGEMVRRGYHDHLKLEQILICIHGSCKIHLDDGEETTEVVLDRPDVGLYLSMNVWREIYDFSKDAVLLVLASELYDESYYIKDYNEFSRNYRGIMPLNHSYRMFPFESALFHVRRGFIGERCIGNNGSGSYVGMVGTIDSNIDIPFKICRAFYVFGTEAGIVRGCHSNKKSKFALICLTGSCRVKVRKSGNEQEDEIFLLDQPDKILVLSEMAWKEMYDFSESSVLLCLSSEKYNSEEYIRDFDDFLEYVDGMKAIPALKM